MPGSLVIGLSAVVIAIQDGQAVVLTVRPQGHDGEQGLPFGPFDPQGHRTFELALRAFVSEQTAFDLGYVEQLYTFGDKGRDAPLADVGAGSARVISVGYLALAPRAVTMTTPDTAWTPWTRFFPWEDWRTGRPGLIEETILPALSRWAEGSDERLSRARLLFALDGGRWNEERVLERYELLYEAGLVQEAARDRGQAEGCSLGEAMISDHRRILATGLGRLRGKLRYRPVVFELTPAEFTLSALQRNVEAIAGITLHKQNFRRGLERTELVEGLGRLDAGTGGRPAELFRYRREQAALGPTGGLALPLLRDS
jgi:hypothetical protein